MHGFSQPIRTCFLSYRREKGTFNSLVDASFFGVNPKIKPVYIIRDLLAELLPRPNQTNCAADKFIVIYYLPYLSEVSFFR